MQQHSNDLLVQMINVKCSHLQGKKQKKSREKECTNQNIHFRGEQSAIKNMGYCVQKQKNKKKKHEKINKNIKMKNNEKKKSKTSDTSGMRVPVETRGDHANTFFVFI